MSLGRGSDVQQLQVHLGNVEGPWGPKMLTQPAINYGPAACVHPSAAVSVGRNSTVRYMTSPVEIQQHQTQYPAISSHSSCCSSAVSPAVAAATAADANWLSQQLSDMQRLRQSMTDGMCRTPQPSLPLPPSPPLQQVQPATSTDEIITAWPNDCENRNANAVTSVTAPYDVSPPRATEQPRHSHANVRRRRFPNSRRDCRDLAQCCRQPSPYMSSEEESFSAASVSSSHTDDEEEAERVSRTLKQYQSRITGDERTALVTYYAANNDTDDKTSGQATTTPVVVHPAPADIEAMYTNFLTVSRKLSSLIADYYVASTVGGQQSLQATERNDTQQQPLSAEPPSHLQHQQQTKRPSLILPSPLRRSLESQRIDQQSQPLPQPPPPVPPHSQPQSQVDVVLKLKQQQQQQQEQSVENAKKFQRTSRKGDRNKDSMLYQHQQTQSLRPRDDRAAAARKALGIGNRIRASLGRLSPRLRRRPKQLAPPEAPSNFQTPRAPTPRQQPQLSQPPHMNITQATAATTQPPVASIVGFHDTIAAAAVSLDTRIRLVPDGPPGQSLDPCLQKLQRLRSTVLGLVQRSVDPVLQSLRDIQGRQHGDEAAERGSQREAAASTASMEEVLVSLQDVMSLMELLSRSVMLVCMHNLDPNSLKLVYLSSSYIRSLKRLSKTLAHPNTGSAEEGTGVIK